jgi:hypothetical protein
MEKDRLSFLTNESINLFNALKTKLDTEGISLLNEYESVLTEIQILEGKTADDKLDDI